MTDAGGWRVRLARRLLSGASSTSRERRPTACGARVQSDGVSAVTVSQPGADLFFSGFRASLFLVFTVVSYVSTSKTTRLALEKTEDVSGIERLPGMLFGSRPISRPSQPPFPAVHTVCRSGGHSRVALGFGKNVLPPGLALALALALQGWLAPTQQLSTAPGEPAAPCRLGVIPTRPPSAGQVPDWTQTGLQSPVPWVEGGLGWAQWSLSQLYLSQGCGPSTAVGFVCEGRSTLFRGEPARPSLLVLGYQSAARQTASCFPTGGHGLHL